MEKLQSKIICILFAFAIISCDKTSSFGKIETQNQLELNNFITPGNQQIKFKKVGDKAFLQWYCDGKLQTYKEAFDLKGSDSWLPRYVTENEDYILLRAGCGNPCWSGYFLPLKKNLKLKVISEYLAFDPTQNYVAKINYNTDLIEVENIVTSKLQSIKTENCDAAFKMYCIDTIYFKKNEIFTTWYIDNNQSKKKTISERLKL